MLGACAICVVCLPISDLLTPESSSANDGFGTLDLVCLLVLAIVCTVYSYSEYVELLKRHSVFTVNFANNLEPVYGIILGALILKDYKQLSGGFYSGAAIIVAAVIAYPLLNRHIKRRSKKSSKIS